MANKEAGSMQEAREEMNSDTERAQCPIREAVEEEREECVQAYQKEKEGDVCPACGTEFESGVFKLCGGKLVQEAEFLRSELLEQSRIIGMGSERELQLRAQLEILQKKLDVARVYHEGKDRLWRKAVFERIVFKSRLKAAMKVVEAVKEYIHNADASLIAYDRLRKILSEFEKRGKK